VIAAVVVSVVVCCSSSVKGSNMGVCVFRLGVNFLSLFSEFHACFFVETHPVYLFVSLRRRRLSTHLQHNQLRAYRGCGERPKVSVCPRRRPLPHHAGRARRGRAVRPGNARGRGPRPTQAAGGPLNEQAGKEKMRQGGDRPKAAFIWRCGPQVAVFGGALKKAA
jgi:hypothetical protein